MYMSVTLTSANVIGCGWLSDNGHDIMVFSAVVLSWLYGPWHLPNRVL